jgi:transcriptional regulator with XRE-family HTH domain
MKIGERIRIIREWQGMSSGELAVKANCSQASLSQYETGKRTPTLKHFRGLCIALRIPYDMLLEGIELVEDTENEE